MQVRNPVGAGDALLDGIAYALARDLPHEEVARWAMATGTASAMRDGVDVGTLDEVRALREQIEIEPFPIPDGSSSPSIQPAVFTR